jgi:hypothetical protein
MTCRVIAAALVLMTVFGAHTAEASEDDGASDELALLATEAGIDPVALAGAVDTVGVPPRRYLEDEGLLQRSTPTPATAPTWPIGGALGQRLWCIEGYESRHSGAAVNPTSGARGWLQWLPSTARAWGVVIGDRASEWNAASRIATRGEAFFRSQWVPIQRGLC